MNQTIQKTITQEKLNKVFGQSVFYEIVSDTDYHVKIRTYLSFSDRDIAEIAKEGLIFKRVDTFRNDLGGSGIQIFFEKSY